MKLAGTGGGFVLARRSGVIRLSCSVALGKVCCVGLLSVALLPLIADSTLATALVATQGIRTVVAGDAPIAVATQVRRVTTVVFPSRERIVDVVVGDDADYWFVEAATNMVHIRPLESDVASNVTVVVESGRVWVLVVAESADRDADLVVYVEKAETATPEERMRVEASRRNVGGGRRVLPAEQGAPHDSPSPPPSALRKAPAFAQEPAVSLAVGFVLGFTSDCPAPVGCDSAYVGGAGGEGAFFLSENIAVVGGLHWGFFRLDVSGGSPNAGGHMVGFGGGVRAYGPAGRVRVFGEVLGSYSRGAIGDSWQRTSLSTLSILPGGGIDIALGEGVGVRFSGGVERSGWDAGRTLALTGGVAFVFDVGSRADAP